MNATDSVKIASELEKFGLLPASNLNEANFVIVNMCSVRQSAVDRVFGIKQKLLKIKDKKPISILTGCVLKKDRKKFEKIFDYLLDIKDIKSWQKTLNLAVKNKRQKTKNNFSINVPIMIGCNNFCSYCVVPFVRGQEYSRPAKEIICEIKKSVRNKAKEIWLLGQNVNSYKDKNISFPKLLKMIDKIPGEFWIRFTSSHPKDFSSKLIDAMASCKKITPYLNLPVQSGDNDILRAMNRHYTVAQYKEIIKKLRKKIPDVCISTDVIVGFPGETKKQFENTAKLFKAVKYDMAYINKYSPRSGTTAEKLKDNVPIAEKKKRERILTEILKKTALKKNNRFVGKTTTVLIESKNNDYWIGKNQYNKTVKVFSKKHLKIGGFNKTIVTKADAWGLEGFLK